MLQFSLHEIVVKYNILIFFTKNSKKGFFWITNLEASRMLEDL